jgi:hypothetical protein
MHSFGENVIQEPAQKQHKDTIEFGMHSFGENVTQEPGKCMSTEFRYLPYYFGQQCIVGPGFHHNYVPAIKIIQHEPDAKTGLAGLADLH